MNVTNSSSISKTNSSIMEYLHQKMEAKSKTVSNLAQMLNNIYDLQSLQQNKKALSSQLQELEADLRQASFAIKGLLADNKALTFELAQLKLQYSLSEDNSTNYIDDLTTKNSLLQAENADLKEQLALLTHPNQLPNEQLGDITEENETETQPHNQPKQNDPEHSKQLKANTQVKDIGNILLDMKNNKKKLKDEIQMHFSNEQKNSKAKEGEKKIEVGPHRESKDQKRFSSLLERITKSTENLNVLNEKLGNDFLNRFTRKDCGEEYLTQIENILNENEEPTREKVPMRMRSCKSKSKSKEKIQKRNDQRSLSNSFIKISTPLYQSQTLKEKTSFETSLRDYPKGANKGSKPRFNPYLNPYGKYFTNPNEQEINIKPISQ